MENVELFKIDNLKDLYSKNKLKVLDYHNNFIDITDKLFNNLISVITVIDRFYTNKWDISYYIDYDNIIIKGIIIHYPEVIIENSKKTTHKIEDLFVRLPLYFCNDSVRIKDISGFRTTLTDIEVVSDYCHSHLKTLYRYLLEENNVSNEKFNEIEVFCLGTSDINHTLAEINTKYIEGEKLEDLISILCVQLQNMVQWESLEGVPYRRINEISYKTRGLSYFSFNQDRIKSLTEDTLKRYWLNNLKELELELTVNEKGYLEVIGLGNFTKGLEIINKSYLKYIYAYEYRGSLYDIDNNASTSIEIYNVDKIKPFKFRDKLFKFTVKKTEEKQRAFKYIIPNMVKEEICKVLNNRIYEGIYKKSRKYN